LTGIIITLPLFAMTAKADIKGQLNVLDLTAYAVGLWQAAVNAVGTKEG
jgi:hypothetical protein